MHGARIPSARSESRASVDRSGALVWVVPTLLALALRVLYYVSVRNDIAFTHLMINPETYDEWARALIGASPAAADSPPFYFPPGYAYFLAGVYRLFGPSMHAAVMVQIALGTATVTLITSIAARMWSRREAWVAGLLAALYGPYVFAAGELLPETLFLFLIALAMVLALAPGGRAPSPVGWSLSGLAWAAILPLRSVVVFLVPLIALDALRRGGRRAAMLVLLPMLAVLAFFVGINVRGSGRFVLVSANGGVNLLLGNYRGADGVNPFPTSDTEDLQRVFITSYAKDHPPDRTPKGTFVADLDAFQQRVAIRYGVEHPAATLRLLGRKFLWSWSDRELPNNVDVEWKARRSWLFRPPMFLLGFGAVFALAVAGVLVLRGRERSLLLWIPVVLGVGTTTVFLTNGRFRLPMTLSLLSWAAFGLCHFVERIREERRTMAWRVAAPAAIGLAILLAYGGLSGDRAYYHYEFDRNAAVMLFQERRYAEAIPCLERSVRRDPEHRDFGLLVLALDVQGECHRAFRVACEALATTPGSDDPHLRQIVERFLSWHGIDAGVEQELTQASGAAARNALIDRIAGRMKPHPIPHPFSGNMRWID
jgi:hypothetical protein